MGQPEWLDKGFLSSCLQGGVDGTPKVTVSSFKVQRNVVPSGSSYSSNIMRVHVDYNTEPYDTPEKSVSLIIKENPEQGVFSEILDHFKTHETNFYSIFWPKAQEKIKEQIVPKTYHSPKSNVIVLEDLSLSGFSMANRHDQLDFNQCKQYFNAIAKLHAAGIVLSKEQPEFCKMFPNMRKSLGQSKEHRLMLQTITKNGLNCLINRIEGLNTVKYSACIETLKKVLNITNGIFDDYTKSSYDAVFTSFVHGDCWATNMMFRYDNSGDPTDIRILDFQNFNFETVALDVINFTWLSANNHVLENNMKELHMFYCEVLNSTLKDLGSDDRIDYNQLKVSIRDLSLCILFNVGVILPLTIYESQVDVGTVFSPTATENKITKYYEGKHFNKKFPYILKILEDQDVFDWLNDNIVNGSNSDEQ